MSVTSWTMTPPARRVTNARHLSAAPHGLPGLGTTVASTVDAGESVGLGVAAPVAGPPMVQPAVSSTVNATRRMNTFIVSGRVRPDVVDRRYDRVGLGPVLKVVDECLASWLHNAEVAPLHPDAKSLALVPEVSRG